MSKHSHAPDITPSVQVVTGHQGPDGAPSTSASRRRWVPTLSWLLAVLAATGVVFAVQYPKPQYASGDTYWLVRDAVLISGQSQDAAEVKAGGVMCHVMATEHARGAASGACAVPYRPRGISPRYVAIFDSRPGFPLVIAAFYTVTGLWTAVYLAVLSMFLASGVLAYVLARLVGLSRPASAVAGPLLLALPLGHWGTRVLSEGTALATTLLATIGVVMILRHRRWAYTVTAVGMVAVYAAKSAQGAAVSVACLGAGAVLLAVALLRPSAPGEAPGRGRLRRPDVVAGAGVLAVGAVTAVGWLAVSTAFGLPSLKETVQDLATAHFTRPDIPHPLSYLERAAKAMWQHQVSRFAGLPWPLWPALLSGAFLVWRRTAAGLVVAAVACGAFAIATAHPMLSQYDRLVSGVWLVVAMACAAAIDLVWDVVVRLRGGRRADAAAGISAAP